MQCAMQFGGDALRCIPIRVNCHHQNGSTFLLDLGLPINLESSQVILRVHFEVQIKCQVTVHNAIAGRLWYAIKASPGLPSFPSPPFNQSFTCSWANRFNAAIHSCKSSTTWAPLSFNNSSRPRNGNSLLCFFHSKWLGILPMDQLQIP